MSCCQFRIESELGEVYWTIQQTTITYYRKNISIHFIATHTTLNSDVGTKLV
jgi:hypothetical protein